MIRTLICEDHTIVRDAIGAMLASDPDVSVVATTADAGATMSYMRENPVDVAVLDLHLPDMAGVELASLIRSDFPHTKTMFLTGFFSDELVLQASKVGAYDVVSKSSNLQHLAARIKSVADGRLFLDRDLISASKKRLADKGYLALMSLGETDKEILALIAQGCTDKEIGARVYLSPQTIRNRISRLLSLLGRDNRTQLALMMMSVDHMAVPELP
jgi:two-component system response regulator DevR